MAEQSYYLGIDLGGTHIRSGVVDGKGRVVARERRLTEVVRGAEAVMQRIIDSAQAVVANSEINWEQLAGIGIGSPGPLDSKTGVVLAAHNLGWYHVPLKQRLQEALPCPVLVDNDANVVALGEHWRGAGRGVSDFVCLTLGTGIGGGIIANGTLLRGSDGNAGELGHLTIDYQGPLCGCGNRGCIEAYASAVGISQRIKACFSTTPPTGCLLELAGGEVERITPALIYQAAEKGDRFSQDFLEETGTYLGLGLVSIVNMLRPAIIALGGGIAQAGERLFRPIRRVIGERAVTGTTYRVEVVPVQLGADAALIGAAKLAMSWI